VFSDRENPCFRNAVYPIYKKHREGYDRPSLYDPLTEWLKMREQGEWYLYPTMEADDVLGIKQTHCTMCNVHTVIVSIDKDMLTIPGYHLNPNKADDGVIHVDEDTADYNWMMQTLAGDRVDNYKGAPGIGPGGAAKLLDPWKGHLTAMWEAVLEGYHAQWGKPNWNAKFQFDDPYVEALANARCARILRYCDHNPETKEPILWTP
jgi:DNA polymerase-1